MASIFTYQEEPPRVHSPWSTPGHLTPRLESVTPIQDGPEGSYVTSITKLEPERQDGPTEYKLHLLLRSRTKPATLTVSPTVTLPVSASRSLSSEAILRSAGGVVAPTQQNYSTINSREVRLQQLTTQLLWRLQQSSPFHSSSNASLVLPVLPEATPRLGVPDRPAKLLPGLEESQGALYEIGVADDGTLVGLVVEELEESLNNLRAMAASLGCIVDILRRVLVGQHSSDLQDVSQNHNPTPLWVAEVLVRPDSGSNRSIPLEEPGMSSASIDLSNDKDGQSYAIESTVEQIRVAVVGASTAGKSSLVGTLTTSVLDNGRGKSRLSLLKHRHEIGSGITSSVAQELIGYGTNDHFPQMKVINYASGDVSSWPDIHNLSRRLVFLSDSPGLPRYAKSAFRALISWDSHWTLFCVPADAEHSISNAATPSISSASSGIECDSTDLSLAHLSICLKLDLQIVIVVTKMDVATKTDLRATLTKILSVLKSVGRKPVLLGAPSEAVASFDDGTDVAAQLSKMNVTEQTQLRSLLDNMVSKATSQERCVPIVLTSSVTGTGFGKLHGLLKELPIKLPGPKRDPTTSATYGDVQSALVHVDEIFSIPPSRVYHADRREHSADHGIVLCGHVAAGMLSIGDHMRLGPFWLDTESGSGESSGGSPKPSSIPFETSQRPIPQSLSGEFSKSLQGEKIPVAGGFGDITFGYVEVQIVSLRSLRLPVRMMGQGETGTVGVQPVDQSSPIPLSRARKGMILSSAKQDALQGYKSFSAVFTATDFSGANTPPLILGSHATVYINSIRAAAKVVSVSLMEAGSNDPSASIEMFRFDGDGGEDNGRPDDDRNIRIKFKFVSSIEWVEIGRSVLVIPHAFASGPVTGPPSSAISGLSGFVGTVNEVYT